jgi:hypothetical protein
LQFSALAEHAAEIGDGTCGPARPEQAGPSAVVSNGRWQNWSAKVEYDFYDFGTRDVTFTGTIFGVPEVVPGINVKQTISTVKFGVNYRFGAIAGAY